MFVRSFAGMLFLAAFLTGCSRSANQLAEVSGKVLYQGKPVPGGVVTFISSRGVSTTAVIDPQGHYQLKAPIGDVQIGVDNRMLDKNNPALRKASSFEKRGGLKLPSEVASKQKQGQPTVTGTYVFLPKKFHSPDSSGLTYTVKSGAQTHDVDLSASSSSPPSSGQ